MKRRKPKATAVQRTVSLFTGRTDLERPDARDGTPAAHEPKRRGTSGVTPASAWQPQRGSLSSWLGPNGARIEWRPSDCTYVLKAPWIMFARVFGSLTAAIAEAEARR